MRSHHSFWDCSLSAFRFVETSYHLTFWVPQTYYNNWNSKSQEVFGKILGIEEGNRFSPVPLKIGLWPERHSRHLFCPLPKGVWRMGTLFPPQSPFLSYLKYSSIIPACKGFSCSSHSCSKWFHQCARRTRWSFDIQRGHSLPLPVGLLWTFRHFLQFLSELHRY